MLSRCYDSYRVYGAPQPLQAAPFLPCHTRFVPQRSQVSNLFTVAPQFWHEYMRLPPLAIFWMCSAQSGHAFWSWLMGSGTKMRVIAICNNNRREDRAGTCSVSKPSERTARLKTTVLVEPGHRSPTNRRYSKLPCPS